MRIHRIACGTEGHPHILRILGIQEDEDYHYLFLTHCVSDIYRFLSPSKSFHAHIARVYFAQLMSGVMHLHSRGICHLDLCMENLLIAKNKALKICDFGSAREILSPDSMRFPTPRGKLKYMAPEMFALEEVWPHQCDLFACGVILFVLLTGEFPFDTVPSPQLDPVFAALYERGDFTPRLTQLMMTDRIPEQALDLLRMLLCPPKSRQPSVAILDHPFIQPVLTSPINPNNPNNPNNNPNNNPTPSNHLNNHTNNHIPNNPPFPPLSPTPDPDAGSEMKHNHTHSLSHSSQTHNHSDSSHIHVHPSSNSSSISPIIHRISHNNNNNNIIISGLTSRDPSGSSTGSGKGSGGESSFSISSISHPHPHPHIQPQLSQAQSQPLPYAQVEPQIGLYQYQSQSQSQSRGGGGDGGGMSLTNNMVNNVSHHLNHSQSQSQPMIEIEAKTETIQLSQRNLPFFHPHRVEPHASPDHSRRSLPDNPNDPNDPYQYMNTANLHHQHSSHYISNTNNPNNPYHRAPDPHIQVYNNPNNPNNLLSGQYQYQRQSTTHRPYIYQSQPDQLYQSTPSPYSHSHPHSHPQLSVHHVNGGGSGHINHINHTDHVHGLTSSSSTALYPQPQFSQYSQSEERSRDLERERAPHGRGPHVVDQTPAVTVHVSSSPNSNRPTILHDQAAASWDPLSVLTHDQTPPSNNDHETTTCTTARPAHDHEPNVNGSALEIKGSSSRAHIST